jgi:hypothetical protein
MEMINKRRMDDNEDDLVLLYGVPADMIQPSEESASRRAWKSTSFKHRAGFSRSSSSKARENATQGSTIRVSAPILEYSLKIYYQRILRLDYNNNGE